MRDLLDGYLAGTLDVPDRDRVASHLAECAECAADLAAAHVARDAVALAPLEIQPPRDLWPEIRHRLPARARRRLIALATAALIFVAVASSLVTRLVLERHHDADAVASTEAIENGYQSASARLVRALDAERAHLSPATIATVERNLAVIDAAIAESRSALAADPGNRDLAALLWASYRQKVALLEQATRLAERS